MYLLLVLFKILVLDKLFMCLPIGAEEHSTEVCQANIVVFKNAVKHFPHFWKSTGFCPPLPHNKPNYFGSADMKMNLALIGRVPHNGFEQVRIHWLLDLIVQKNCRVAEYNFRHLDRVIHWLIALKLRPGFELMGSPSGCIKDFSLKNDIESFRNLVLAISHRYTVRYSIEETSRWNFETWNEPDHHDFDNVSMDTQGFRNYYDACSEGLADVSDRLKLGGPGASCRLTKFSVKCWNLLQHTVNGTSFFTGRKPKPLSFISFHKKGGGCSRSIIDSERQTIDHIAKNYPSLSSTPVFNDEGDPMKGWSKPRWWRQDATYASMVVKVISFHILEYFKRSRRGPPFALLSNDNAFLSWWPHVFSQRTLLARFQMNSTSPPHVHFVQKPVYAAFGLLSLLGDHLIDHQVAVSSACDLPASALGAIATLDLNESRVAVVVYASDDTRPTRRDIQLNVTLGRDLVPPDCWSARGTDPLPESTGQKYLKQKWSLHKGISPMKFNCMVATYTLNNKQTNPWRVWKQSGASAYPTKEDFQRMHDQEGPATFTAPEPLNQLQSPSGQYIITLSASLPGILLINVCYLMGSHIPHAISDAHVFNITFGEVLLTWDDSKIFTKCIKTYEVEFRNLTGSLFRRIWTKLSFFPSFTYISEYSGNPDDPTIGTYRIRATDYWDRSGKYTEVSYGLG